MIIFILIEVDQQELTPLSVPKTTLTRQTQANSKRSQHTNRQAQTTLQKSTGSADEISTTIINAKYPMKQLIHFQLVITTRIFTRMINTGDHYTMLMSSRR